MFSKHIVLSLLVATLAMAMPLEKRAAPCTSYTIISARGTGERQGDSVGFVTMNANILRQQPGGTLYNVVYPAASNQDSSAGTADIIRQINTRLAGNPSACFFLEGYSQGASATVNAINQIGSSGAAFDSVRGVFLIGNPYRRSGLACNVDGNGGTTTRNTNGISQFGRTQIPTAWIPKTLDVCINRDSVCDRSAGFGITYPHLTYGRNANVQSQGTNMGTTVLSGGTYTHN